MPKSTLTTIRPDVQIGADLCLFWLKIAARLAVRGHGFVEPNPMVGCVIVDAKKNMVGWGYHRKIGGAHAEVEALKRAGAKARGATAIVTLEPCAHFGRTPPCVDALKNAGVACVVAGETAFSGVGFALVMVAAALSGLRCVGDVARRVDRTSAWRRPDAGAPTAASCRCDNRGGCADPDRRAGARSRLGRRIGASVTGACGWRAGSGQVDAAAERTWRDLANAPGAARYG